MYKAILKINFVYLLTYRANFINNIISALAWGGFQVIWIALLTGKRGTVFGWTPDDMILLTFGYFMVLGIFHFLFSRNFDMFSRTVDRGELDAILLKPIDSQFHATTRIVSYANLIRAFVGLVLIIVWVVIKHYTVTPLQIVLFSLYIFVGIMTLYSIWLIFITTLIWYPNLNNMVDLLYTVNGISRYPSEIIRTSGKMVLYILIPLSLSISAPMKILLHKNSLYDVALLTVSGFLLFVVSRMFWKHSLKSYMSAS